MGWFEEQIKERKISDEELFSDAFANIAAAVLGQGRAGSLKDAGALAKDAIEAVLGYYHIKIKEIPPEIKELNDQLEYLMRPYGVMRRSVILEDGWYKDALGAMLVYKKDDNSVVALIPNNFKGYSYIDHKTGKKIKVNRKNQELFDRDAIAFYKPFPLKSLGIKDLFIYMGTMISPGDIVLIILSSLVVTGLGFISPMLTKLLFGTVIDNASYRLLVAVGIFMIFSSISALMFGVIKSLCMSRLSIKLDVAVEAATMMRILSLPADFFKNYSAGELNSYSSHLNSLCNTLIDTVLSTGITSLFSLAYIAQIFNYAPELVTPSLIIILITVVFSGISALWQMKITKQKMILAAKESGTCYSLISGVQKIKLSGAEKRAFAKWGEEYAILAKLEYNPPMFLKINGVISTAISLVGTIVMFYMAVKSNVSVADYYSFNTAYAQVSGAFTALAGIALTVAKIKPSLDISKPILEAVPEISEGKQVVSKINGNIELNNVSFRYTDSMPNVVDNMSLKIKAGQYVAIVGKTGCGKSTLVRLLLGFEKPQKGAIYYDGKDIGSIDLKSLRKKIGVVIQNGKLFQGDIFSNITISAPWLTLDDAWRAAELAGIADDIREMPMGMNTMLSEGEGGISGGQRQRLMIARAVAPNPKLLIFDEATSALDNITQKKVSEALAGLKCTRIVIAHRLSTIKQCDKIIVLDQGHIIEEGTYDSLIEQNGYFAELVERQRLDK